MLALDTQVAWIRPPHLRWPDLITIVQVTSSSYYVALRSTITAENTALARILHLDFHSILTRSSCNESSHRSPSPVWYKPVMLLQGNRAYGLHVLVCWLSTGESVILLLPAFNSAAFSNAAFASSCLPSLSKVTPRLNCASASFMSS